MIPLLLALLVQNAEPVPLRPAGPDEKKVRELLEKLDSDEVAVRNQAQEELAAMGEGVVPLLEKARAGAGAEARGRIDTIVGDLTMPAKWAKEFQDDAGGQEAYQRLETSLRGKTLNRKQAAGILSAALLSDKTTDTMKQMLMSAVERHRFTELWPVMLQLAVKEDGENSSIMSYVQRMKPPAEAADDILKVVPKIRNRYVAMQLLQTAANLKPDKAKVDAAIRAMLEADPDENTKSQLLSNLSGGRLTASLSTLMTYWRGNRGSRINYQSYLREAILRATPDGSVKELLEGLSSGEAEDAVLAADYASRHKLAEAVGPLVEALYKHTSEDRPKELGPAFGGAWAPQYYRAPDQQVRPRLVQVLRSLGVEPRFREWLSGGAGTPPRTAVALAIGELELKGLSAEAAALLGDKDAAVRREAARALGALKQADAVPALEARLKDENLGVRRAALHAIVRIRGAAATATVLEQLRAEHPDAQAAAIEVLAYMDADAVIDELTKESNLSKGVPRYALAVFLVNQGEANLHRVMARVAGKMSADDLQSFTKLIQAARGWR